MEARLRRARQALATAEALRRRRDVAAFKIAVEVLEGLAGERQDAVHAQIAELYGEGASPATIAAALNSNGLRTQTGKRWHPNAVLNALVAAESR